MRVVIVGGSGFIGRELTRQLLATDNEVLWLTRDPDRTDLPAGVAAARFDHTGADGQWVTSVGSADAVVNLSGHPISSRWNPQVKRALRETRVGTNRSLVTALRRSAELAPSRRRVFVSASGIGIYGNRGADMLDEREPPGSDFLSRLAVDWEAAALEAAHIPGMRVVCVRTGLVLGEEGLVPRLALPMRLFVGGPVGLKTQWLGWIHISDIAAVYRHALFAEELSGPLNAVAPEPSTMRQLTSALGQALHRPSWLPVPGVALRLVLGEVAPYMTFSQRALPAALLSSGFAHRYPELDTAMTDAVERLGPGTVMGIPQQ